VQAEAVGHRVPDGAALEEVECSNPLGELLHGLGAEDANGVDDVLDLGGATGGNVVGEAHDGDGQRDVGLDGLDDLGDRNPVTSDQCEQPVAGLGERREPLERGREPPTVSLTGTKLFKPRRAGRGVDRGNRWVGGHRFRVHPCGCHAATMPHLGSAEGRGPVRRTYRQKPLRD
jgi:hypothetical protein